MNDWTFAITIVPWGGFSWVRPTSDPRRRLRLTLGFVAFTIGVGDAYLVTPDERTKLLESLALKWETDISEPPMPPGTKCKT